MPNFYREKLYNAIVFFARETSRLNMTKLSKLLHYFDFRHFAETGYPALGLIYQTFPRGPVPATLWRELKDGYKPEDFGEGLSISVKRDPSDASWKEIEFRTSSPPDMSVFSPREQRIISQIAEIFRDATGSLMSEASHQEGDPWDVTRIEKGMYQDIDYLLGLNKKSPLTRSEAEENLKEYFSILNAFSTGPEK